MPLTRPERTSALVPDPVLAVARPARLIHRRRPGIIGWGRNQLKRRRFLWCYGIGAGPGAGVEVKYGPDSPSIRTLAPSGPMAYKV
jgi:hypothetical protein